MEAAVGKIPWEYVGPIGAICIIMLILVLGFALKVNGSKKDMMDTIADMKSSKCCDNPRVQKALDQNAQMQDTIFDMKGFMVDTKVVEVRQTSLLENQTNLLVNLVDETRKQTTILEEISKNGRK